MAGVTFNVDTASQERSRADVVPTKILEAGLISETSEAYLCFTQQKFSGTLQTYMINYVVSISGYYSVYA